MAYKKYIKRNGKVYGPYIYHSRRVNGKVVSEYRGQKKEINYSKIGYAFLGLFALVILLYGASHLDFNMTGQAILNLDAQYTEGEPIQGNLKLFVKEGELIPQSSKIIFETDTDYYEYNLEDILNNNLVEGDYYVKGKDINGFGAGYGIEGTGEIYPEVYFSLNVLSSISSESPAPEQSTIPTTESNEETIPVTNETTEFTEEVIPIINETIEQPTETIELEPAEENQPEPVEEIAIEEPEPAPLTGGVISNFFSRFTPTGKVTLGIENTLEGNVRYGEEYIYDVLDDQTVELVEGSVKTSSVDLEEGDVILNEDNGELIITTDYYEIKHGFGKEYLGDDEEILNINLGDLNMVFNGGELKIRLVYGEEEITTLTTFLAEEGEINAQSEIETTKEDITEEISEESEEEQISVEPKEERRLQGLPKFLTDEERKILLDEYGQEEIGITKTPAGEGKINVRFELRGHWFEETYDVSLSKEELALEMDEDKTEWLREIIISI